ncbi:MAG: DUF3237 family protein [Candidatus Caldarchaeum sp.]|jgi:hypothetical protein
MELEPFYELEAQIVRTDEIGETPYGRRSNFHMKGTVKGKINGTYEGIDYGTIVKTEAGDVVHVYVRETITTEKGIISGIRQGYAVPSQDGLAVRLFIFFHTQIPEYRFLNWTLGVAEGKAGPEGLRLKVSLLR